MEGLLASSTVAMPASATAGGADAHQGLAALGGGQVGAVYPTVQTTAGLLSVPDSALSDQARRMLAVGAEGHHKSLRGRHETVLAAAPPPPA